MSERYRKYGRAKKCKCKNPDCGLEFKSEGSCLHCPKCHSAIDIT